jgi:hypothetical protein
MLNSTLNSTLDSEYMFTLRLVSTGVGNRKKSSVAMGFLTHSLALKRAVCTTLPVHCSYLHGRCTNPHTVLSFAILYKTEYYTYTEIHQPTLFYPEDGGSMYL